MMADGIEVKSEFEKIFGAPTERPTLFSPDDEQYNALRQYIINAPSLSYDKTSLPFNDVKVEPFEMYLRRKSIEDAESRGYHVFYLKSNRLGDSYDAMGYFDKEQSQFVLMKASKFKISPLFKQLIASRPLYVRAVFSYSNDICTVLEDVHCPTVSVAASYVMGCRSDLFAWIDQRGNKIDAIFDCFNNPCILQYERDSIAESKPKESVKVEDNPKQKVLVNAVPTSSASKKEDKTHPVPGSLEGNQNKIYSIKTPKVNPELKPSTQAPAIQIFYIEREIINGIRCKASCYYDAASDKIVLQKDSLLALDVSSQARFSTTNGDRRMFLNQHCNKTPFGYTLKRDTLCDNPSKAAYYVSSIMPANGWMVWKDKNGKSMKEIYKK